MINNHLPLASNFQQIASQIRFPSSSGGWLSCYHVRYIYVGELERQAYAQQSTAGLDKFDHMVGSSLRIVYRSNGVTIYEVL